MEKWEVEQKKQEGGKEEVEVVEIKSAWLALRVDARLYNIKANSFLSNWN